MSVEQVPQFPVVRASGSNYEVGMAIGRQLKDGIGGYLEEQREILGSQFNDLLTKSAACLTLAVQYFPKYIEELEGVAAGAQVPFVQLFLANNREVSRIETGERCTIVAIPRPGGYILGHNEDWVRDSGKYLYILDATIDGVRIVGLNYCYEVVGGSVAVNGYGVAQGVNELVHGDDQIGVPKNIIARAALNCRTLNEAEQIIRSYRRAGGFNHVLVQGNDLMNLETSATQAEIERITGEKYVHTNHYLMLKMPEPDRRESKRRYDKVKREFPNINTAEDLMRVLSDTTDPPISRNDDIATIGSVVVDSHSGVIWVAVGQPRPENYYPTKI